MMNLGLTISNTHNFVKVLYLSIICNQFLQADLPRYASDQRVDCGFRAEKRLSFKCHE